MQNQSFIYALLDPRDGSIRYIGQTSVGMRRVRKHFYRSEKRNLHVYNWIRALRALDLEPKVSVLLECDISVLNKEEEFYISYLKSLGCNLTNHTGGGGGIRGFHHSTLTKAKLSKALSGKEMSPEARAAMSLANKGRKLSEATKVKISAGNRGKVRSEGVKARISNTKQSKVLTDADRSKLGHNQGQKASEETRKKQSIAHKDKTKSQETRQKIANAVKSYWDAKKANGASQCD